MLDMSMGMKKESMALDRAVSYVLDVLKYRTRDLGGEVSTIEMGDAISDAFRAELKLIYS